MIHISDLFGIDRFVIPTKKGSRALDERAGLLTYFHSHARNKEGKEYPIAYIGMKLSYLKLTDLYYLKSVVEQESARGKDWGKIFWGSIKAK